MKEKAVSSKKPSASKQVKKAAKQAFFEIKILLDFTA